MVLSNGRVGSQYLKETLETETRQSARSLKTLKNLTLTLKTLFYVLVLRMMQCKSVFFVTLESHRYIAFVSKYKPLIPCWVGFFIGLFFFCDVTQ